MDRTSSGNARLFLLAGSLLGGLGVALGAFGAHGLKKVLDASLLEVYETAVLYQFLHALALLIAGLWLRQGGPASILADPSGSRRPYPAGASAMDGGGDFGAGSADRDSPVGEREAGASPPVGGRPWMVGIRLAGWSWLAGATLFSGSLYLYVLSGVHWLAFVTPAGGTLFILGWLAAGWAAWRQPPST
ncbi:MAG: DUF423 domain-containing protein [Pseudomonadota bacterium]